MKDLERKRKSDYPNHHQFQIEEISKRYLCHHKTDLWQMKSG